MRGYSIYLRLEATEALKNTRGKQRSEIITFIDSLTDNPDVEGDYSEHDHSDRMIEIKIIGQYAVTYWADHAVKEMKVVDIRRADRA